MLGIRPVSAPSPEDWQEQLQASLRRAQDAIARSIAQQEQMVQSWTAGLRSAYPDWGRQRWQRKLERKLRKRAEREARVANATLAEGYRWLIIAAVFFFAALGLAPVGLFLLIPAFSVGSRAFRVISRHLQLTEPVGSATPAAAWGSAQERPVADVARGDGVQGGGGGGLSAPAQGGEDPRDLRVDAICRKLLDDLRHAPPVVKEMFRKPEETVASLRTTCRELTRRERSVRRFLKPEEDVRLERERAALASRVEGEVDEVTRLRLASALAALDQQRQQRKDLARSASRFDAEHTRISYTLESLHTQVIRMGSADAGSQDVAGAGLRRSLDLLSQEVDALAEALEKVNAEGSIPANLRRLAEGPAAEGPMGPPAAGSREKA